MNGYRGVYVNRAKPKRTHILFDTNKANLLKRLRFLSGFNDKKECAYKLYALADDKRKTTDLLHEGCHDGYKGKSYSYDKPLRVKKNETIPLVLN
jgi:hypothetical protein